MLKWLAYSVAGVFLILYGLSGQTGRETLLMRLLALSALLLLLVLSLT